MATITNPTVILADPRQAITVLTNGVKILPSGQDASGEAPDDIFEVLWLNYRELCLANSVTKVKESDLKKAFNEWLNQEVKRQLEAKKQEIKCSKEDLSELDKFLKAIFPEGYTEFEKAVFAHQLWQVKCKLYGNPSKIHNKTALVLFGNQGVGKSVSLQKLFEPLAYYKFSLAAKDLSDTTKIGFKLNNSFVAIMDELAGIKRTEIEDVKGIITAETIDVRKFRSQHITALKQNCTFFATSNRPLVELIKDNEQRRFFELTLPTMVNFEALNQVDFLKLWQGIDESREIEYIAGVKAEVKKHQATLTTQDEFHAFVEELNVLPTSIEEAKLITKTQLYQRYVNWAEDNRFYVHNSDMFYKKMNRLGLQTKRVGKANIHHYYVNKDFIALTSYEFDEVQHAAI